MHSAVAAVPSTPKSEAGASGLSDGSRQSGSSTSSTTSSCRPRRGSAWVHTATDACLPKPERTGLQSGCIGWQLACTGCCGLQPRAAGGQGARLEGRLQRKGEHVGERGRDDDLAADRRRRTDEDARQHDEPRKVRPHCRRHRGRVRLRARLHARGANEQEGPRVEEPEEEQQRHSEPERLVGGQPTVRQPLDACGQAKRSKAGDILDKIQRRLDHGGGFRDGCGVMSVSGRLGRARA